MPKYVGVDLCIDPYMKHTIFISDLHLQEKEPEKTESFLKFLKSSAKKVDAIYILGDLFDFWIGDDNDSVFNQKIKTAFKKTTTRLPIYIMGGNRDFLLGKKFAAETGCVLIKDPTTINLYGINTLLTHGDMLFTNDHIHLAFRKISSSKCNILFLLLPIKLRQLIARFLRATSRGGPMCPPNSRKGRTKYISTETTTKIMQQHNITQIIHGHIHTPDICNTPNGKRFVLGAWEEKPNILVYYEDHTYEYIP